jgi:hypothetical protein
MQLKDARTRDFLPEWSLPAAFLCDALDGILKHCDGRLDCLLAPMTLEACLALDDDEMQTFYEEMGIAAYYPDITHWRRAWLLYMQNVLWRFLGTPDAMESLCKYLFDQIDIELDVQDNLAFDESGNLIDEDLLDAFDAELSISAAYLPENMLWRILANIKRFTRNSQWMRAFTFLFELDPVHKTVSCNDGDAYAVGYLIEMSADARAFASYIPMPTGHTDGHNYSVNLEIDVEEAQ